MPTRPRSPSSCCWHPLSSSLPSTACSAGRRRAFRRIEGTMSEQALSWRPRDDAHTEPGAIRFVIVALAVLFLLIFVVLPLVVVFASAFSRGVSAYFSALAEPEALSAIRLTLLIAAISVSLNLVF